MQNKQTVITQGVIFDRTARQHNTDVHVAVLSANALSQSLQPEAELGMFGMFGGP